MNMILAGNGNSQLQPIADYIHEQFGSAVAIHLSPTSLLQAVQRPADKPPELVVMDITDEPIEGAQSTLQALHAATPDIPLLVLASYEQVEHMELLLRAGAMDVLAKPIPRQRLRIAILNARRMHRLRQEVNRALLAENGIPRPLAQWESLAPSMLLSLATAQSIVKETLQKRESQQALAPIWLSGAFGTGRQQLARAMHAAQHAASTSHGSFEVFSCDHPAEGSLARALFGSQSGRTAGAMQRAAGGTLYLERAETLPAAWWAQLLAALPAATQLVCESEQPWHPSLTAFSALAPHHPHVLVVPELHERADDTVGLAMGYVSRYAAMESLKAPTLTEDATAWLRAQRWPGNLPELGRLMQRLVLRFPGETVNAAMLRQIQDMAPHPKSEAQLWQAAPPSPRSLPVLDEKGNVRPMAAIEDDLLRFALEHHAGCISRTARALGIGRSTLYRRLYDREESPQSA